MGVVGCGDRGPAHRDSGDRDHRTQRFHRLTAFPRGNFEQRSASPLRPVQLGASSYGGPFISCDSGDLNFPERRPQGASRVRRGTNGNVGRSPCALQ